MEHASPDLPGGAESSDAVPTPDLDLGLDLYRGLVEDSRDGIWVFDLDGRVRYANPRVAELLGVPPGSVSDLSVFDTLDEPGRVQFAEHLEELRAGVLNTHEVEVQFVRRDGSTLWLLVQESPWNAPDGSLAGVVHRMSDDSRRRAIIEELRSSRAELAEAERIARIAGWTWDVDSDRITSSEQLLELFGFTPDTVPRTFAGYLELVHPDDRHLVHAAVESALSGTGTGTGTGTGEFDYTVRVALTEGWRWVRGRGVARSTDGSVTMSGTHQDVTEVTEAQLALVDQVLQNTLMQAVASAANEAATLDEVLGRARDLVLLHEDWERARGFVPDGAGGLAPLYVSEADQRADEAAPERRAAELELAQRVLDRRSTLWDDPRLTIGFPVLLGTDVCAVVTLTSAPPLYRHEMIESMVAQVSVQLGRVAERERAQRELADARDQAMAASRQKSEFLATMSHEIRTPLNGVIGLTDLLVRTDLDPGQQRLASGVQVASRALLALINDVLDFSKIEAGRLELEQVDFDVRDVFDQVTRLLGEQARGKNLELLVAVDPAVPQLLRGDPTRLTQVLTNLGSNAVKFTEHGEVAVTASAENGPDDRVRLRVAVSDTGSGIDPERLPELFEPFTQGDASTTRMHGGTGLGLAISREIVAALDGELQVQSEPGTGSTFSFTVLLGHPRGAHSRSEDDRARETLTGRRALVVDDLPARARVLEQHLARWGMRVDVVAEGPPARDALARPGDAAYDVVLLGFDGGGRAALELAAGLLDEIGGSRPAVLLVGGDHTERDRLATAGVDDVVATPVVGADLRQALEDRLVGAVETAAAVPPPSATQAGADRGRVLVVEDNEVNQMVAAGLLESLGFAVETADDGRAATLAYDAARHDAVLMDVQMPHMDGYAATQAIRSQETPGRRVPVIAMTASAVEGERERCLAAGMDDFLTKPVDPGALASVLGRWLGGEVPTRAAPPRPSPHPGDQHPTTPAPAAEQGPHPEEPPVSEDATDPLTGLDLDRLAMLRDLDPGNTAYLDRAIGNFCRNSVTAVETIAAAIEAADAPALRAAAHKLAGSALNLGAAQAGAAARELEFLGDADTTEGAAALVAPLEEALEEGRQALRAYQRRFTDAGQEQHDE
ncbi:response regulator [Nocardioides ferulae]|uniref:response regulator n=1 Tax=Nocardioides ferulae TaxID=2340821 RepID=UPI000EB02684|nr:response regulator [Nocardioides ferulae]